MKQQLRLTNFCEEYDVPYQTAIQWIHSKGFPAFKQGKSWYVDIPEYLKWRKIEHQNNYKYA